MKINKIALAFFGISFSWTFSWFAVKSQAISQVPIYTSIGYRFILAGILCLIVLKVLMKKSLKINTSAIKFIFISSIFNCFLNFIVGYTSAKYIPTGITAAIMSLTIITSEIFNSIMEKKRPSKKTIMSGAVGFFGLSLFIYPTLKFSNSIVDTTIGFLCAIFMAIIVCPGYYAMKKCVQKHQTPLLHYISYMFLFGGFMSISMSKFINTANSAMFDFSIAYISSLLYLAIFASCIAYISLYYLMDKIGVAKANYSSFIYTIGAISISTIFEDYEWSILNLAGFTIIMASVYMQFGKNEKTA